MAILRGKRNILLIAMLYPVFVHVSELLPEMYVPYLSLLVQGDRFLCEHCYQLTAQTMAQNMAAASTATTMAIGTTHAPTPTAKTEATKYGKAEFGLGF